MIDLCNFIFQRIANELRCDGGIKERIHRCIFTQIWKWLYKKSLQHARDKFSKSTLVLEDAQKRSVLIVLPRNLSPWIFNL